MITRRLLSLVLSVAFFVSCTTSLRYVVLDHVPETPVVTVIPGSLAQGDIEYADQISGMVLSCGVKVIERPVMMKEQSQYQGQGSASAFGAAGGRLATAFGEGKQSGEVTTGIDPVSLVSQTTADYVFIAVAHNHWLKIVRRESGQVLYSGSASGTQPDVNGNADVSPFDAMRRLLTSLGVVKDKK